RRLRYCTPAVLLLSILSIRARYPPRTTLFPYTTLFRSEWSANPDHTGMADHTADPDRPSTPHVPDYPLDDGLTLEDPAQYRALFEETRQQIVTLLSERAATVSELAATLQKPKGTVGHHMQVLADAGLVHVVRTQKVRALVAKYWGRTARIFYYHRV